MFRDDRDMTMPAGRVLGVVVLALLVAALLNSEAIVRAGEGMRDGTTRDVVLAVGRPLDDVAGAVGLQLPREGFDLAFGQETKTAAGTELERGSARILEGRARRAPLRLRQPTPGHPLRILVTGDSEAAFVGEELAQRLPDRLARVETVPRNGTSLTRPGFFNWELNARQEVAAKRPDAIVMLIGGNDGFNVVRGGEAFGPTTREWQTEYARRTAVIMRILGGNGTRPVYWAPPPAARDSDLNAIYRNQNGAVERAARAVPGGRYVDIYTTLNGGRYSDAATIDGRRVLARQPDGIHFSREGAALPTRLLLRELRRDYPALARR